jgi:hypothetical protein
MNPNNWIDDGGVAERHPRSFSNIFFFVDSHATCLHFGYGGCSGIGIAFILREAMIKLNLHFTTSTFSTLPPAIFVVFIVVVFARCHCAGWQRERQIERASFKSN